MQTILNILYGNLNEEPDKEIITFIKGTEKKAYKYYQLINRIVDYQVWFRENKYIGSDTTVLIVDEISINIVAAFFAAIAAGVRPAFFAYPSEKHSEEQFFHSLQNLHNTHKINLILTNLSLKNKIKMHANHEWNVETLDVVNQLESIDTDFGDSAKEGFIQFSSGTTGIKKGVLITSKMLLGQLDSYYKTLNITADSKIISWLPHYHDMGLVACILMPIIKKIPVVYTTPFEWVKNPQILFNLVESESGTHVWLPNFALGHITKNVSNEKIHTINLNCLRKIILCSEPALSKTIFKFREKYCNCGIEDLIFENCYAMAENTFAVTTTKGGLKSLEIDQKKFRMGDISECKGSGIWLTSAGKCIEGVEVKIIDDEEIALGDQKIGEIAIKSNFLIHQYLHSDNNESYFTEDNWFKTGDLGFLRNGNLYIAGRKKELIIIAGENIYSQDIEDILNANEKLIPGRNVAFGIDDTKGTEALIILAEVKDNRDPPNEIEIRREILNKCGVSVTKLSLVPHMTLLKGTAGKISRSLNRQKYLFEQVGSKKMKKLDTVNLALELSYITGVQNLEANTPLISSGIIDSFSLVVVKTMLEELLGVKIPEDKVSFANFETIKLITQLIESLGISDLKDKTARSEVESDRNKSLEEFERVGMLPTKFSNGIFKDFFVLLMNKLPIPYPAIYKLLLRLAGIKYGRNLKILGKIKFKINGNTSNIQFGDFVTLGDGVDIRIRESGTVILGDRVYVDSNVRLVAARNGNIFIGCGSEIGFNSVINSGGNTTIGRYCMIASGVNINSSKHGVVKNRYIKTQPHSHGIVNIGDDVWIGAGVSILINSYIETGAIIGSNSVVSGKIPEFSVSVGVPAKVIQYRS